MMPLTVTVNAQGRVVLPASIRKELNIEKDDTLEVEARDGGIFLRPAVVIPREDAWAYTPEHLAAVERARNQPAFSVSPEELEAVINANDPQAAVQALIAKRLHE